MNRRHFLRRSALLAGFGAGWSSLQPGTGSAWLSSAHAATHPEAAPHSRWVPSSNIRDYLSREAGRITDAALRDLPSPRAWQASRPTRHRQFLEMMGLDDWWTDRRDPPPVKVTGVLERDAYRIEKLYYESWPGLYVTANLYLPRQVQGRVPGVLYVCGHSRHQKHAY